MEDPTINNTKVLIVEDDRIAARILKKMLEKNGCEADTAKTGKEALQKVGTNFYNLVLLDIMLPDTEGTDLIKPIKTIQPDIGLVMVTAHSSHERAIFALNMGATGYITKPVKPANILPIIKQVVEKQELIFKNRQLYEDVQRELKAKIKLTEKLKSANQTIIEQQNALVEEERLKMLLQMAGATATELNQPLSTLAENIEFIRLHQNEPSKVKEKIEEIERAGKKISDTIGKIHWMHGDKNPRELKEAGISIKEQKLNVLSVEDDIQFFNAIKRQLRKYDLMTLYHAPDIKEAFAILDVAPIDLILLDFQLSDGDGLGFLNKLKDKDKDIPCIIITGKGDEVVASQLIHAGAYEYLPKARLDKDSLYRAIQNTVERHRLKAEVNATMGQIAEMSTKDALTTLYNRRYFTESLNREIGSSRRYEKDLSLLMVDIDHFKKVNDTYGHVSGDVVLKKTAQIILDTLRDTDIACRYGGEEFVMILPYADLPTSESVAERLRKAMENYEFELDTASIKITISVGVACYDRNKDISQHQFVEMADNALYQAKTSGRNRVVSWSAHT